MNKAVVNAQSQVNSDFARRCQLDMEVFMLHIVMIDQCSRVTDPMSVFVGAESAKQLAIREISRRVEFLETGQSKERDRGHR